MPGKQQHLNIVSLDRVKKIDYPGRATIAELLLTEVFEP